jgi:hypothetical protein
MRQIVLCCSLSQLRSAQELADELRSLGAAVVLPERTGVERLASTDPEFRESHEFFSSRRGICAVYFEHIASASTVAVVAVNAPADGRPANYIGATTFAELAVGFAHRKPLYLTHRHYGPFEEDLRCYGARELGGDREPLLALIHAS